MSWRFHGVVVRGELGWRKLKYDRHSLALHIMKGETQGFPRHEVSDKQEVLFEDVSPSTAFSIRQLAF